MTYRNTHYLIQNKEYVPHVNIKIPRKERIFPTISVVPGKKKYAESVQ